MEAWRVESVLTMYSPTTARRHGYSSTTARHVHAVPCRSIVTAPWWRGRTVVLPLYSPARLQPADTVLRTSRKRPPLYSSTKDRRHGLRVRMRSERDAR